VETVKSQAAAVSSNQSKKYNVRDDTKGQTFTECWSGCKCWDKCNV